MAKCKLEELTIDEAEKALAVAIFTNSVKAKEIAKSISEKNKDFKNLDDFVKSYSTAESLRGQAKKIGKREKVEVKLEPVGNIKDKEAKKRGLCYKCNEKWTKTIKSTAEGRTTSARS